MTGATIKRVRVPGRSPRELRALAQERLASSSGVLLALPLLVIGFGITQPGFLSSGTALTVWQISVPLALVAAGMTYCLIAGEVDLSVGAVAGLAGVVTARLINAGVPWIAAIAAAILAGVVVGLVNGFLTIRLAARFKLFPSFLATLATTAITFGVAQNLSPLNQAVPILDAGFGSAFGFGSSLLTTKPVFYALLILAGVGVILRASRFGHEVFAVGASRRAASLVGVNVAWTQLRVMVLSAVLAAMAGVMLAGYSGTGSFQVARGIELDAIAAAVLGGTYLFGGRGTLLGTLGGVLVLGVLNAGLLLSGQEAHSQLIAKGVLVLAAVAFGNLVTRPRQ
jgi:ribose transport system permease protein